MSTCPPESRGRILWKAWAFHWWGVKHRALRELLLYKRAAEEISHCQRASDVEAGRKSALGKPAFTPRLSPLRQCAHVTTRFMSPGRLVRNFEAPLTFSPGKPPGLRDGLLRGAPEGKNRATFTLPFERLAVFPGVEVVFGYPPFFG